MTEKEWTTAVIIVTYKSGRQEEHTLEMPKDIVMQWITAKTMQPDVASVKMTLTEQA